jgi:hypothetical protein
LRDLRPRGIDSRRRRAAARGGVRRQRARRIVVVSSSSAWQRHRHGVGRRAARIGAGAP